MDSDRRLRFQVSPVLMLASLIWAAWLDPSARPQLLEFLTGHDASHWIGVVAGTAVLVFAFGYVIGTFTYVVLWGLFRISGRWHEAALSDSDYKLVTERLQDIWREWTPDLGNRREHLFAVVAFDHGLLRAEKLTEGIHLWLVRRWNAFSISVTSTVGLALSFFVGPVLGIQLSCGWFVSVGLFLVVLILVAIRSWHEVMEMLGFMARLRPRPTASPATPAL